MKLSTRHVFLPGLVLLAAWTPLPAAEHATGFVYHDLNANGHRDDGEPGVPGVRVSNQRDVVRTDDQGRWQLPASDDCTFFVIKPRDWMTPVGYEYRLPRFYYTHKPAGSPEMRYGGVPPTGELPQSIDFPLYQRREPDTFRALFFGDTQARNERELEYMAHDVIAELIGFDGAFGVTLGDIVFDNLAIFEQHNRTVALIGIPWYNVIGNHDMNYDAPGDRLSDESFERVFGPNYYAFDHGPVHFLVLDNVRYHGRTPEGKPGRYSGTLGQPQLTFIANDLAHVPPEKLVVLLMHIPLIGVEDREALFRLIEDRPHTLSVSAHTHSQSHEFLTSEHGWQGAEPHHHVIHATVCGSWWQGAPDELGIPHATMHDGAPNGYSIVTFDGHEATFTFKAARRPADYQMNIHAPYTVPAEKASETEVVVNVFAGSQHSVVEMRLGTEGVWQRMERVEREDPAMLELQRIQSSDQPPRGLRLGKPKVCRHLWAARLPANPQTGLTVIHVRTTDMYNQTYEASRAIHIR